MAQAPIEALEPAIVFLGAGLAAALASRALKLSPIVGYLLAGVAIGPHALKLVEDSSTTHFLAELGVVFLLFDIGLHFSIREMKDSRRDILGLAPAQMLLCGVAFTLAARAIGCDWPIAVALGVSLALSSTAVVARILADRNLPGCPLGRSSTAVLIFQDICAIFLLVFAASLEGDASQLGRDLGIAAGLGVVAFAIALLAGRFVVRPLFRILAATRNEEAFTAVTLFIVLAAGAATGLAGLSLTLGAFLAGMAISDSPYRHVIQTEVKPFKGLLIGLFFIAVGMGVDLVALAPIWPAVFGAAIGIVAVKTAMVFLAAKLNGWSTPGATQLSFLLSQGSEFTLVVAGMAAITTGAPAGVADVIVAAVALSLVAAPAWSAFGMQLARMLVNRVKTTNVAEHAATAENEHPVLVYAMTEEGRFTVDALRDHDIPYIAIDVDTDRFVAAATDGYDVIFGDASDTRLLDAIGVSKARAFVLGAPRYEISAAISPIMQKKYPDLKRFVAVHTPADRLRYEGLGMRAHISGPEPKGVELATDVLRSLGVPGEDIAAWISDQIDRRGIELAPTPVRLQGDEAA